jgi:hypothetical protein
MTSLTPREKERIMKELLDKFKREQLAKDDAETLKVLLQEKQDEAFNIGDMVLAIGFAFLLAGLIGYLSQMD